MRAINGKERMGAWVERYPAVLLVIAALLTFGALHYAQEIEMAGMDTEQFVGKESPLYQAFDHLFMERFGTVSIMVVVEGDDVTTPSVLKAMDRLGRHMSDVPRVLAFSGISGVVADAQKEETGIRGIPDSQERIDEILAGANPVLLENILPDRRHTILGVEVPLTLSEAQMEEVLTETEGEVVLAGFPPNVGVIVTGNAALGKSIKIEMARSYGQLMGIAGILMIFALLLVFRHVNWPLLPLPIVFLGLIWTFGLMGLFHLPMTMVSMSAFPILIGIGIDYAIQFHSRIEEEFNRGGSIGAAVVDTVSHTAPAVFIALTITAAGFVSLFSSSVPVVRQFGLLCLMGLVMCYLSALIVEIPLLYLVERWRNGNGNGRANGRGVADNAGTGQAPGEEAGSKIGTVLEGVMEFSIDRRRVLLLVAVVLAFSGTYADTMVPVDTDFKNYIPQDLPPLVQFRHLQDIFGGTDEINVIIQGDDITDPATMKWMYGFQSYLVESREQILGSTSIATYVKAFNGGAIPDDATQIRRVVEAVPPQVRDQYLSGHDTAVIDLNIGSAHSNLGSEGIDRLLTELEKDRIWYGPPPGIQATITGEPVVMTTVIEALTTGRTKMTLLGLVMIFLILLVIYRDLIKALVPVLPMIVVIGWMGGVLYMAGMSYTPLTATLGALILGVGSEYSILMMERFYEELERTGDMMAAMRITSSRIGAALAASGMTTVFGFAALMASSFGITSNFGTITVMAVVFALLTTFTIFPVLLVGLESNRGRMGARMEALKSRISNISFNVTKT